MSNVSEPSAGTATYKRVQTFDALARGEVLEDCRPLVHIWVGAYEQAGRPEPESRCRCGAEAWAERQTAEPSAGTALQYGVWHQRCPKCGMNRLSPNVDKSDLFCDECGYSTSVPVSDPPSAGTARPDAAPTNEFLWAWNLLKDLRLELSPSGERAVNVILAAIDERDADNARLQWKVAEREAECERLRADKARIDYLESHASIVEVNPRRTFAVHFNDESGDLWDAFDDDDMTVRRFLDVGRSAAVAPAAREPTTETSDGE